jgi:Rap1a immunity proteins
MRLGLAAGSRATNGGAAMIVKCLLAGAVIAAISLGAAQAADVRSFTTEIDLLEDCQSGDVGKRFACAGYIAGVADALDASRSVDGVPACVPIQVELGQVKDTVVRYLEQHPAVRNTSAASLVRVAINNAWHCGNP